MKKALSIATLLSVFLFTYCTQPEAPAAAEPTEPTLEEAVARGAYLVGVMGCNDCHSPKRMGPQGPEVIPETMLSGYPADRPLPEIAVAMGALEPGWSLFNPDLTAGIGPWGISFAANLTSDETGIGNWTEEQFRKALTEGKSKGMDGARMLLPPMPWFNFTNLEENDLKAIFAYLKSTKPVSNVVPAPIPPDQLQ